MPTVRPEDGLPIPTRMGQTTADASGTWTFTARYQVVDGVYSVSCRGHDAEGAPLLLSELVEVTIDTFPPTGTTITRSSVTEGDSTVSNTLILELEAADSAPIAGFCVSLNGEHQDQWNATTVRLDGVPLGTHTVEVRALDAAGNADPSPTQFHWTILQKDWETIDVVGDIVRLDQAESALAEVLGQSYPFSPAAPTVAVSAKETWNQFLGAAAETLAGYEQIQEVQEVQAVIPHSAVPVGEAPIVSRRRSGGTAPIELPTRRSGRFGR